MDKPKDLEELINFAGNLMSLPQITMKINTIADDANSTVRQLATTLSQDPALASRLLRIANSPFYGFAAEISTIDKAVGMLGMKTVRNLTLGSSVNKVAQKLDNNLVSIEDYWPHSILASIAAREIGAQVKRVDKESVFIAGLLHDLGHLVMFSQYPELSESTQSQYVFGPEDKRRDEIETENWGFSHAQVAAELMKRWNLPTVLHESVGNQHTPLLAKEFPKEATIIHIAVTLATHLEMRIDENDPEPTFQPDYWKMLELNESIVGPTMDSALSQMNDVKASFGLN